MKGQISKKIICNSSALAWNDNLYRSLIPFKWNLRDNFKYFLFLFKIKITVFPSAFSTMPLTNASVSTGQFLTKKLIFFL